MEIKHRLQDLYRQITQQLLHNSASETINQGEASTLAALMLEHYLKVSKKDILLNRSIEIHPSTFEKISEAIQRVADEEPIQYILGEAHFYGRTFAVSPAVLIPRRETEELVHLVITENPEFQGTILDIGTGSGCIAVTLKKEIPSAEVYAWDISKDAIEITKENARVHKAKVSTSIVDILDEALIENKRVDIVVSNPPYVRRSEAAQMQKNVLNYEPHGALFVTDEYPLLFYQQIAELCTKKLLKKGGRLYLEINEFLGHEVAGLLERHGFQAVEIIKDMQKRHRFVKAIRQL